MLRIVPIQPVGIAKDCGRFLKWDAMFLEVGNGLRNVPRKHIIVYTLIRPGSQGSRVQTVGLVYLVYLVSLVCGAESATSGTGETRGWLVWFIWSMGQRARRA